MSDTEIAFHCFESAEQVATEAARRMLAAANQAIGARGRFQLVLAGGRTPLAAYTLLVDQSADWDRWHIFFGDERCVPEKDPDRNSSAAASAFLDRVPIPAANRYPIPAELGAEEAAARYESLIRPRLPFDLVVLGLGEDGHTASLFPGQAIPLGSLVMPVHQAPKPPPDRVSLTPRALVASAAILILVTGGGKREALRAWREGADSPVARVVSTAPVEVLMDRAAAGVATAWA
ncbi:6-phosphogluconolactonase [Thiocystis violacea]|uniref:6-phosphogluconolactonase n=1 Tax=Thiocystis violacea TaxID=13725 RepID=UPI001902F3F6|nr:6-phosphogluconolactonase [Thiocystis violacea]MBK1719522.1 6-phosphogluconolactonase [Thiocystis violacea]